MSDRRTSFGAALRDFSRFERVNPALDAAPALSNFTVVPEGATRSVLDFAPGGPNNADAVAFINAAKAHQTYLVQQAFLQILTFPAPTMVSAARVTALLQSVNPRARPITMRVQASTNPAAAVAPGGDPLEPILDAPVFPQPMYEAVRDLSQDFLFPGLDSVPPNTVTLLRTNPSFVEAYLVGLNSEMARRAALAQLPDRSARHVLPPVLGRRDAGRQADQGMGRSRARPERRRWRAARPPRARRAVAPLPELGDLRRGGGVER